MTLPGIITPPLISVKSFEQHSGFRLTRANNSRCRIQILWVQYPTRTRSRLGISSPDKFLVIILNKYQFLAWWVLHCSMWYMGFLLQHTLSAAQSSVLCVGLLWRNGCYTGNFLGQRFEVGIVLQTMLKKQQTIFMWNFPVFQELVLGRAACGLSGKLPVSNVLTGSLTMAA